MNRTPRGPSCLNLSTSSRIFLKTWLPDSPASLLTYWEARQERTGPVRPLSRCRTGERPPGRKEACLVSNRPQHPLKVLPLSQGGVECSAAQRRPEGGRKSKCANSQRSPGLFALVMKSSESPSPGTFLGSLDTFQVYWYFQKHQQGPKRLCYSERKLQAFPKWRDGQAQDVLADPKRRTEPNSEASNPSSEAAPSFMRICRCHYTSGELWAEQSQKSREPWIGVVSVVAHCSHWWPHIFLVSSSAGQIRFRLFPAMQIFVMQIGCNLISSARNSIRAPCWFTPLSWSERIPAWIRGKPIGLQLQHPWATLVGDCLFFAIGISFFFFIMYF